MSTEDDHDRRTDSRPMEQAAQSARAEGDPGSGPPADNSGEEADSINDQVIRDLRSLSTDDPDGFLVELIDLFQTDAVDYLARIEESAKTANASAVRKNAHGLKGSSGNLGAQKMSALCNQIEAAAGESLPDWNKMNPLIVALSHEAVRVKRALDQRRHQAKQPK